MRTDSRQAGDDLVVPRDTRISTATAAGTADRLTKGDTQPARNLPFQAPATSLSPRFPMCRQLLGPGARQAFILPSHSCPFALVVQPPPRPELPTAATGRRPTTTRPRADVDNGQTPHVGQGLYTPEGLLPAPFRRVLISSLISSISFRPSWVCPVVLSGSASNNPRIRSDISINAL